MQLAPVSSSPLLTAVLNTPHLPHTCLHCPIDMLALVQLKQAIAISAKVTTNTNLIMAQTPVISSMHLSMSVLVAISIVAKTGAGVNNKCQYIGLQIVPLKQPIALRVYICVYNVSTKVHICIGTKS